MAKVLVVDDEEDILVLIKNVLTKDGHEVVTSHQPELIRDSNLQYYDLILLDVMMPELDGFTLCKEIRDIIDIPIIFITAKTLEVDLMEGFAIGADDYIKKPFSVGELRARVQAHVRREMREKRNGFVVDGIHFNLSAKEIHIDENKISFTKSEYAICEFLAKHKSQVFSKEIIYEKVFGYDGESDASCITEHVKNIRNKLNKHEKKPIETVWGIGYKWVV